jgi:hypothetical protein
MNAGASGALCTVICWGVLDVHLGIFMPTHAPSGGEGVSLFLTLGGGSIWTIPPPQIMSMPNGYNPAPLTLGLGASAGVDFQGFVSEAPNFGDFSEYSLAVGGGAGAVAAGGSINAKDQKTFSIGPSLGVGAAVAEYGSYTWGITFLAP